MNTGQFFMYYSISIGCAKTPKILFEHPKKQNTPASSVLKLKKKTKQNKTNSICATVTYYLSLSLSLSLSLRPRHQHL